MDRSICKKWVDKNINEMLREFGLSHWRIVVDYVCIGPHDDGFICRMKVSRKPEYERAIIKINFDQYDTEEELREDLAHELMHIVHSPFDMAYAVLWDFIDEDNMQAVKTIWSRCEEMTVRNMERMHWGLTHKAQPKNKKEKKG